ncbi:hypothetical protein HPB50_026569 [Hyalomma asiaticum]|uniref:Uncharacterized protein n=1 Tax=Hyalomma asiaticum TaxID=266040 RepID=A0ACB7TPA8_HYAAI|nr:hypothetical protein HPB50_026569 [Hyalomma asiaticum]
MPGAESARQRERSRDRCPLAVGRDKSRRKDIAVLAFLATGGAPGCRRYRRGHPSPPPARFKLLLQWVTGIGGHHTAVSRSSSFAKGAATGARTSARRLCARARQVRAAVG